MIEQLLWVLLWIYFIQNQIIYIHDAMHQAIRVYPLEQSKYRIRIGIVLLIFWSNISVWIDTPTDLKKAIKCLVKMWRGPDDDNNLTPKPTI